MRSSICFVATVLILIGGCQAQVSEDWNELAIEAIDLIQSAYVDSTLNGIDLVAYRTRLATEPMDSRNDFERVLDDLLREIGDPALRRLTADQFDAFLLEVSGEQHTGVGLLELLSVDIDPESNKMTIIAPVPHGPAAKAGLESGDIIQAINGAPSTSLTLSEAVHLLRTESVSALQIQRDGSTRTVKLRPVVIPARSQVVHGRRTESYSATIAIEQFTTDSVTQFRSELEDLIATDPEKISLDLRNNPGGFLPASLEILGMIAGPVPAALLVGRASTDTLYAIGQRIVNLPIEVLVNAGTASAAEVFAWAVHENGLGTVVGSRTAGKPLLYSFQHLEDGTYFAIPTGRLRSPMHNRSLSEGIDPVEFQY